MDMFSLGSLGGMGRPLGGAAYNMRSGIFPMSRGTRAHDSSRECYKRQHRTACRSHLPWVRHDGISIAPQPSSLYRGSDRHASIVAGAPTRARGETFAHPAHSFPEGGMNLPVFPQGLDQHVRVVVESAAARR